MINRQQKWLCLCRRLVFFPLIWDRYKPTRQGTVDLRCLCHVKTPRFIPADVQYNYDIQRRYIVCPLYWVTVEMDRHRRGSLWACCVITVSHEHWKRSPFMCDTWVFSSGCRHMAPAFQCANKTWYRSTAPCETTTGSQFTWKRPVHVSFTRFMILSNASTIVGMRM